MIADIPIDIAEPILCWIGAAIGAAASLAGSAIQGKQAKSAASTQMDFQREMSNTAYQRGMKDMKTAGLNPILAYKTGGASTPSGASYQPPNMGAAAMQGATSAAQLQNIKAQNANLKMQNEQINADILKTLQEGQRVRLENAAYEQLSPTERLIFMSANPAASAVGAARGLKSLFTKPKKFVFKSRSKK